jgi:hypothetical protein
MTKYREILRMNAGGFSLNIAVRRNGGSAAPQYSHYSLSTYYYRQKQVMQALGSRRLMFAT